MVCVFARLMDMGNYFVRTILVIESHLREVLLVQDWAKPHDILTERLIADGLRTLRSR